METSLNGGDLTIPLIESHLGIEEELSSPNGRGLQADDSGAGSPSTTSSTSKHSLGFGALVFLIYYNVGVPFGDEEAIKAAGPMMVTLAFFIILPIMWQIPICLITAELTTTLQDHRGSIAWVSEAFGPKWGFVDAIWSLATSFLDNALYPIIISDFLGLTGCWRWIFIYICIAGLTLAVYRGSTVVASAEEAVFVLTMLPLVVMVVAGICRMDWVVVTTVPTLSDVDVKLFVQIMFWTSTYWQKVASVGPEVQKCAKNFPRAILVAAGMQTVINGIIHLVASGATDPALYPEWEPGYLRHAADAIAGGQWLGAWLTVTAAVANSGSFLSEMSVTSQTLIGMAERGFLPSKLRSESPHGSHPWALATIVGMIALSQPFDFHALVLICNFLYMLQTVLELAAFYHLRTARPDLERPYRVPGGHLGLLLLVGLPGTTLVLVTLTSSLSAAMFGTLIASATAVAAHLLHRRSGLPGSSNLGGDMEEVGAAGSGGSMAKGKENMAPTLRECTARVNWEGGENRFCEFTADTRNFVESMGKGKRTEPKGGLTGGLTGNLTGGFVESVDVEGGSRGSLPRGKHCAKEVTEEMETREESTVPESELTGDAPCSIKHGDVEGSDLLDS